jgi:8-oxo-dGTP diphosphatase
MNREYPTKPIVAVSVAISCGEEVLFIKRAKAPNQGLYTLPGGGQRLGETTRQAALREAHEETGLVVSGLRLVEVLDSLHYDPAMRLQFHYVIVVFATEVTLQVKTQTYASQHADALHDVDHIVWVPFDEASRLPLTEGLLEVLQKARKTLALPPTPA